MGPGRRRRGHGRKRRRAMGFLQPCMLLLLHRGDAHGYNLLSGLDEFGLDPTAFDPSLIYRALREMESSGWVESYPGDKSRGPRRRVYHITEQGRQHLEIWIEDLRRTRREIELLIEAFERDVQTEENADGSPDD